MPSTVIRIWEGVDQSKTKSMWGSQSVTNINNTINSKCSAAYTITKAIIQVYADFDGAGGLANVYMKYGLGSTNSISSQFGGGHKLTKDEECYSVDITSYFTGKRDPKSITAAYGSYFVANVYTSNVAVGSTGALHISHADLYLEYDYTHAHVGLTVEPTEGGKATGGGWIQLGTTANLQATPNSGYVFDGWYVGDILLSSANPYHRVTNADVNIIARFKVDKINKIRIDTSPSAGVLTDKEDVGIIVDKTKVYG